MTGLGAELDAETGLTGIRSRGHLKDHRPGAARQNSADGPPAPPPPPVLTSTPGGLRIENATLKYGLVWAYGVRDSEVSGPPWIHEIHYNITASTGAQMGAARYRREPAPH